MKIFFISLLVLSFGRLAMAGVDISGEYRFREWKNITENSGSNNDNRFLLSFTFREGDSLMAKLSVIPSHSEGSEAGSTETTPESGTETSEVVNEAYGVWSFADAFELKFGKFAMDWANGSVFANNSFNSHYSTFDGLSLAYDAGMVKVVYAVLNRNTKAQNKMQAVSVDFMSLPAVAKTAHLFYVKKTGYTKYGAVVAGAVDIFNYDVTYASDASSGTTSTKATMIHAKTGIKVLNMGQVVATYHKDEANYNPLNYSQHRNAGLMDVHTWGGTDGLTYYTVGYVHSLNDAYVIGAFYHDFKATDTGDKLGTEMDVYASHKYNDVLTATARYGKYTPTAGTAYNQVMLGLNLNF